MAKGLVKLYYGKRSGGFSSTAKFPAELARHLINKYGSPVSLAWELRGEQVVLTPIQQEGK